MAKTDLIRSHRINDARMILRDCGVALGADYHALSSDVVDSLATWADKQGYRKPRNANGSRARYYHAMLQRRARCKD